MEIQQDTKFTRKVRYMHDNRFTGKWDKCMTIDLPSFPSPSCIGTGCFSDTEKTGYKSRLQT